MNVQNVETITEQTQLYQNLAIILMVGAVLMLVLSIVLIIVFRIPHSFRVLTGMGIDKEISKAATNRNKQKATLTWGNSGALNKNNDDATTLLDADNDATTLLGEDNDATTVLGMDEGTTVLQSDETTLLAESDETTLLSESTNGFFQMEDDIKITGSNTQI